MIINSKKRENEDSVDDSEVENENIVLADTTTLKHPTYYFNVSSTTKTKTTRRVITEITPSLTTKMLLTFVPKKKNSIAKMPCKYKCQRPVTWITTARKNKWTTI